MNLIETQRKNNKNEINIINYIIIPFTLLSIYYLKNKNSRTSIEELLYLFSITCFIINFYKIYNYKTINIK